MNKFEQISDLRLLIDEVRAFRGRYSAVVKDADVRYEILLAKTHYMLGMIEV